MVPSFTTAAQCCEQAVRDAMRAVGTCSCIQVADVVVLCLRPDIGAGVFGRESHDQFGYAIHVASANEPTVGAEPIGSMGGTDVDVLLKVDVRDSIPAHDSDSEYAVSDGAVDVCESQPACDIQVVSTSYSSGSIGAQDSIPFTPSVLVVGHDYAYDTDSSSALSAFSDVLDADQLQDWQQLDDFSERFDVCNITLVMVRGNDVMAYFDDYGINNSPSMITKAVPDGSTCSMSIIEMVDKYARLTRARGA